MLVLPWLAAVACGTPREEFTSGLAIEDVSVVDVESGEVVPERTVVVQGARIVTVAPSDRVVLGDEVVRVDGTGRYLIPGLWDMHAHELHPEFRAGLPLFVANGVTGIRDMWGDLTVASEVRESTRAGDEVAPRFVLAGAIVDGADPWIPVSLVADTPERGRLLVDSLAGTGADFIKVYSVLQADVFAAIVDQAGAAGLAVAGHVPFAVPAAAASDAGMQSMTHMFGIVEGCSAAEAEVRAQRAEWLAARAAGEPAPSPFFDPGLFRRILEVSDAEVCSALLDRLVRNGTWLTPTLTVLRSFGTFEDPDESYIEFVPPAMAEGWRALAQSMAAGPEGDLAARRAFYARQLELVGVAADAGVPILAGTDTRNPFVYQGFSLHRELELLVEAGLSPRAALAAATVGPAVFLGMADSIGTVVPGKRADLVLLEANPLEHIGNTRTIVAVVANGRLFDRAALDRLIDEAKKAVAQP